MQSLISPSVCLSCKWQRWARTSNHYHFGSYIMIKSSGQISRNVLGLITWGKGVGEGARPKFGQQISISGRATTN